MKKIIRKILDNKKLTIALVVLLSIIVTSMTITLLGIDKNVKKMATVEVVTYFPDYPSTNTNEKDPTIIQRGEYLAKAGDCLACHTNTYKKGKQFAGGLPMDTPFGTIYSPNITPDKETGIGGWTDEQFIKAMREGISPQGHYYYPAFPYLYFNKVTTEDLKAIKAYLDSIPPIKQRNLDNEMVWPFNIRFLQLGWRLLFFHPEKNASTQNDVTSSNLQARGAYLVDGLGHCAMCHTPSYHILTEQLPLGAPIREYDLTGAKIQGYLAPNITASNIGHISDEEIMSVFTEDHMIGGGKIEGPMQEVNHDSLKYLSHDDLLAITTYLKSVHSKSPPMPKITSGGAGKAIYEGYCSGCHANGGGGAPKYGDASTWDTVLKQKPEDIYTNAIKGKDGMPAKGTCLTCSDDQIKQAVDYMLASVKNAGKNTIVAKPKKLTLEDGKRIYEKDCSVCHATGFKNAPKPGDVKAWEHAVDAGFLKTYMGVVSGKNGHLPHAACPKCSDGEIKAAVKYMMQESTTKENYSLW